MLECNKFSFPVDLSRQNVTVLNNIENCNTMVFNLLCCDFTKAMTSLGNKNFSAVSKTWSMRFIIDHKVVKQHMTVSLN